MKLRNMVSAGALLLIVTAGTMACSGSSAKEPDKDAQAAAAKAQVVTRVIPAGTNVVMSLQTPLTTGSNHAGDTFYGTTMDAITVDGKTAIPAGSRIDGSLRDVEASGRIKGRARMTLVYDRIVDSEGTSHSISATPLILQAASSTHGDVEKIAAGGVLGAIIGGIADGGKGAAIGAGAGAGAGTILMLATQGDEVELGSGQQLNVHLISSTKIEMAAK
jgi:hypothetical protein